MYTRRSNHGCLHVAGLVVPEKQESVFNCSYRCWGGLKPHLSWANWRLFSNCPTMPWLQMLDSLSQAWEMRWRLSNPLNVASVPNMPQQVSRTVLAGPLIPSDAQVRISIYLTSWMLSKIAFHCLMFCSLEGLLSHCLPWVCLGAVKQTTHACQNVWGNLQVASFEATWQENMKQMQLHYGLLEPYVSLRKVLFQVLNRHDYLPRHLLEFATLARKVCGSLFPILSFFLLFYFFSYQ
jgi:hypothetical protein